MSAPAWLSIAALWLFALFAVVALCKAAGRADRAMEAERRDQLASVRHLGETRSRRDARNGLGRAS
jgi:hypothetical protein